MKFRLFFTFTILTILTLQTSAAIITISSSDDLQKIGQDDAYPLDGHYELTQDIDMTNVTNFNLGINGFFTGIFDGKGHIIKGLNITNIGVHYLGLFRLLEQGGEIKNLGLVDFEGSASDYMGSLVGVLRGGTITNCYSTGRRIRGTNYVGGLVGQMLSGTIIGSYAAVNEVSGRDQVGGLVGGMSGGRIVDCYSTANVYLGTMASRTSSFGGLVGHVTTGEIVNCYSTGAFIRGLLQDGITGGLIGTSTLATVTNSYWDTETSGFTTSAGGEGRTTAQMQQQSNYTGWDFNDIWQIDEGTGYPYLSALAHTSVIENKITRKTVTAHTPLITVKNKTLTIKTAPNSNSELQIKLFDMRGKTLAHFNTRGSSSFSLSKIPAGRYLVETKDRESGKRIEASAIVLR